jgi:CheY-like chemotaxis protein
MMPLKMFLDNSKQRLSALPSDCDLSKGEWPSGAGALAAEIPDIMLLVLMLPEMDGCQLLTTLRGNPKWREIPVIVITALDLTAADRKQLKFLASLSQRVAMRRQSLMRQK